MRDVGQIRSYVWTYLDLEEEDLQAGLIDVWILEAYRNIVRRTRRWPFFEQEWDAATVPGDPTVVRPADADEIGQVDSIYGTLHAMSEEHARDDFNIYRAMPSSGQPEAWTEHAGVLRIYPTPDQVYDLRITGWRQPVGVLPEGTGGIPDFPEELEDALLAWVMHRAYTQQDDPELAAAELARYSAAVDEMVSHHIQGGLQSPLTLGGGRRHGSAFRTGERPVPWGS